MWDFLYRSCYFLVPLTQVKGLYASSKKNNKENQKPHEKSKVQENPPKKVQKKYDKPQEPPKPKPHKSIESALNAVSYKSRNGSEILVLTKRVFQFVG